MATAGDIASAALKKILVEASDALPEPDEYADFLEDMNNYMLALESDGVRLGYTEVTGVSDEVTVPRGAVFGIIANVAIVASPGYGGYVTPELQKEAALGLRVLRKLGQNLISTSYPGTLPRGSGNDDTPGRFSHYYQGENGSIMSLAGNTRETVFTASDTPVRVVGFWNVETLKGYDGDINGRFTNILGRSQDTTINVTLTAIGDSTYTFYLYRNGTEQLTSLAKVLTSTPTEDIALSVMLEMEPGDYVELWVENDLATEALTVTDAQFEVIA